MHIINRSFAIVDSIAMSVYVCRYSQANNYSVQYSKCQRPARTAGYEWASPPWLYQNTGVRVCA